MGKAGKIILVMVSLVFCQSMIWGQSVKNIRTADLERMLKTQDDKLYIVNFWATWCAPCVRELPYFEKLSKVYDPAKVRFILISLDFPGEADKKLIPFLKTNKISLGVDLMQDLDYNAWIATVDPGWYGNLPATLLFNNPRKIRIFHSGEIDESGLRKMIDENLK